MWVHMTKERTWGGGGGGDGGAGNGFAYSKQWGLKCGCKTGGTSSTGESAGDVSNGRSGPSRREGPKERGGRGGGGDGSTIRSNLRVWGSSTSSTYSPLPSQQTSNGTAPQISARDIRGRGAKTTAPAPGQTSQGSPQTCRCSHRCQPQALAASASW